LVSSLAGALPPLAGAAAAAVAAAAAANFDGSFKNYFKVLACSNSTSVSAANASKRLNPPRTRCGADA